MSIAEEAFSGLGAQGTYEFSIKYSCKFRDFNANVSKSGNQLSFHLSHKWKEVSKPILTGLLQELMIKILKLPHCKTTNIDLYNSFIKNLHKVSERVESDALLLESFNRVNERYFNGLMEAPNLVWGSDSRRRLATYDFHTDTVKVSTFFRSAKQEIIDYLVYHELLHKKLKFSSAGSRSIHHSSEFRKLENEFQNSAQLEKEIASMLRRRPFFGMRF
ncbi:MAG: hypothetical protein V1702_03280 [Candidatus Woesearchaeota archaeon]